MSVDDSCLTMEAKTVPNMWGQIPRGFRQVGLNHRHLMLIGEGLDPDEVASSIQRSSADNREREPFYGRALLPRLRFEDGDNVVLRPYFHGGSLSWLTGEVFFTWPPRPFRELLVTAQVSEKGIPTLDVLAAGVERSWGPFYRGWLLTREISGASDLWQAVRHSLYQREDPTLLKAVAQAIRRMHRNGISHVDLHMKNILVRSEEGKPRIYLIDFDKAKMYPGEVPLSVARTNLNRLSRSVRKLDPRGRYLSEQAWENLLDFYWQARSEEGRNHLVADGVASVDWASSLPAGAPASGR